MRRVSTRREAHEAQNSKQTLLQKLGAGHLKFSQLPIGNRQLEIFSDVAYDRMVDISPAVVGLGFGMDQDAEEFWSVLFEADFESCLDVVDTRERHVIADGDVA